MTIKIFPVLLDFRERRDHPEWPRSVPWDLLEPHREQARHNHDQTLERLAQRGGLSPGEMICVIEGKRWGDVPDDNAAVERLQRLVTDFEAKS